MEQQNLMRILITGGAGFIGTHLIEKLLWQNDDVICLDNLFTGKKSNITKFLGKNNFEFIRHDIIEPILLEVDQIYHLACPASPVYYQHNPVKTIKTSVMGTINMLGLAKRVGARILLASTSEVYGDPIQHPQTEEYWGNVNPIGIRSYYDEGKRVAETLMMDYHRQNKVDIRIARIFNTFGPNMQPNDGRVITNFITQALAGKPITIYGDGSQTRSFCYVDDMALGLVKLMNCNYTQPVNLGNPQERTILETANIVNKLIGNSAGVCFQELPKDDPLQRKPDITKAKEILDWEPTQSKNFEDCLIATTKSLETQLY